MDLNQATNLARHFKQESEYGKLKHLDLSEINWSEHTEGERKKAWALIFSGRKEDLINFLFSVGGKIKKEYMPINESFVMPKREAQEFPSIPKDIYQCELLDVEPEKRATYDTRLKAVEDQEIETVLKFQFTLLEGELRGRNVWDNFVPAYLYIGKNGKNKLFKIIEAFIKRELTPEELSKGITSDMVNKLIGHQVRLSVEPKSKGDKTFDAITDYYKVTTLLPKLTDEEKTKATVKNKEKKTMDASEAFDEFMNGDAAAPLDVDDINPFA